MSDINTYADETAIAGLSPINGDLVLNQADSSLYLCTNADATGIARWKKFANDSAADPFVNRWGASFDGSNDYLDISSASSAVSGQADFSISFWYYATTDPGRLIGAGTAGSNRINISQPNSTFYFGVSSGPTATAPSLNAWHHIVCVKSGTTGNIYIDGNLEGTGSNLVATTASNQGDDFSIGRLAFVNEYGTAKFDEVAVFNSALDQAAVTALYGGGAPSEVTGAAGWWRMGDDSNDTATSGGSIATITDSSGNGNDATQGTASNQPTFSALASSETIYS
jgi:hypothetical protein